jgi:hypothetical protein
MEPAAYGSTSQALQLWKYRGKLVGGSTNILPLEVYSTETLRLEKEKDLCKASVNLQIKSLNLYIKKEEVNVQNINSKILIVCSY